VANDHTNLHLADTVKSYLQMENILLSWDRMG